MPPNPMLSAGGYEGHVKPGVLGSLEVGQAAKGMDGWPCVSGLCANHAVCRLMAWEFFDIAG